MLQELMLRRAGALLLVVVALFSCLAPVLGTRVDTIRPEASGLTTIPPPEIQQDMGSPMAPVAGDVTMVLPEAREQEKGGTIPDDAPAEIAAGVTDDLEKQNGLSEATVNAEYGRQDPMNSAGSPSSTAIHEGEPDSEDEPTLDDDVSIVINTLPMGLMIGIDSGPLEIAPAMHSVQNGSTHMLYTISPQPPNPVDTRFRFDRWIGGPTTWGWNVTINGSQTFTARFIPQYLITILANIPGPVLSSDIPGCDVQQPAPIYCWVDENFAPTLIVNTPQGGQDCRFSFIQWSDGDVRTLRPIGPVTGPETYVAMFTGECMLTLNDTCTGNPPIRSWFTLGDTLSLEWLPPSGLPPRERYRFEKWICDGPGCYSGPDPNPMIIIQGPINETAVCYHEFFVTVDTSPTGIGYTIDDLLHNGLTSVWWTNQTLHRFNLTVLSIVIGSVRYVFTHWSDGVLLPDRQVLISAPEDYIAYYERLQVKLTLSPPLIGDIRCVEYADCWYDLMEWATAEVTSPWADAAETRLEFVQWSGDASGTNTSARILMDASKEAIALWYTAYRLTVISDYGNPQCSKADCWYPSNAPATVTLEDPVDITAGARQKFSGWTIDATGNSNPLTLTMDAPQTVEASWEPQFYLTVTADCGGNSECMVPAGEGWFFNQSVASLTVNSTFIDSSGIVWDFDGWAGDASGKDLGVVVLMDSPKAVTARWVERTQSQPPAPFPLLIVIAAILVAVILAAVLLFYVRHKRSESEEQNRMAGGPHDSPSVIDVSSDESERARSGLGKQEEVK